MDTVLNGRFMHLDSSQSDVANQFSASHSEVVIDSNSTGAMNPHDVYARLAALTADNKDLQDEISQLRADRARMTEILSGLTGLLGSKSPEKLLHDVRNVLNERELYRVLAEPHM